MSVAEALLGPADALRSAVYRAVAPGCGALFADRARRVWWLGVSSTLVAFVVTGLFPLWSLALGPVVLGVPHLLADVRYLVVRQGLHRNLPLLGSMGAPLVATSLGAGPAVGLLAMLPALGIGTSQVRAGRAAVAVVAWLGASALAFLEPVPFQLAFLHAHNLIALTLWWMLRGRTLRMAAIPLLAVVGSGVILLGGLDGVVSASGGLDAPLTGTRFSDFVEQIAPDLPAAMGLRLVLSFCFLQAVHYVVWLRLVPEDARTRPAPRPFRASLAALVTDFGVWPLAGAAAACLVLAVWAFKSLPDARLGYLRLAAFHGYLEVAIAARWWVQGRVA